MFSCGGIGRRAVEDGAEHERAKRGHESRGEKFLGSLTMFAPIANGSIRRVVAENEHGEGGGDDLARSAVGVDVEEFMGRAALIAAAHRALSVVPRFGGYGFPKGVQLVP